LGGTRTLGSEGAPGPARLGPRGIRPHALRHSFATHFHAGGAAITDLQHVLGHASITTTQIYARAVHGRTRASLLALDFGAREAPISEFRETMHTSCTPTPPATGEEGASRYRTEMPQVAHG